MFARPVNADFARSVIASGKETKGCRTIAGPPYGKPAATQVCRLPDGKQRVRHAGLFGQTWLTCELAATEADEAEVSATAPTMVLRGRQRPEYRSMNMTDSALSSARLK